MSLEGQIADMLKTAMMDKDRHTTDTLRMLKTKITERRTSAGFSGLVTDEIVLDVIASYKKSLQKAIVEFAAAGDRGKEQIQDLNFEITICDKFLPKQLDEQAIMEIVIGQMKALNITDPKQSGRLMGSIMKEYKNKIDGATIKKIIESVFQN